MYDSANGSNLPSTHQARRDGRRALNGSGQVNPTRSRRSESAALVARPLPDRAGSPRDHSRLLPSYDDQPASPLSLAGWRVPAARPSADGQVVWYDQRRTGDDHADHADRSYRRVADGLAIAPRVSVVLPVMNEAANLPAVFATIPAWVHEVVLVDGRSTDNTVEVAKQLRPGVKVVLQGGVGKGDALVAGFMASTGDILVAIDGDGSTDGAEMVRFVSALMAGADFVKGSRFSSAGWSDDITTIRRLGNRMLNVTVNRLFHTRFSDLCYGYNAFWAQHLGDLALDSPGFEVETLMSIRAAEAGLRIYEVPSHERLRQHGSSNLSAVKDGWRILRLITREKRSKRGRKARKSRPFMAPGHLAHDDYGVLGLPEVGRSAAGVTRRSAGQVRQ